ncbi:NUDIX domain-containing protein [Patescibacteria group bacterium]|nr:NUDIX domain-containing protein [Patescibacteria group bacterium]
MKYDEKSCGVVVFKENEMGREFLLLLYPGGHWDLVKGHVEEGEDEIETATRELIEETGISDIAYVDGFREKISYHYTNQGRPSHKQVIFFLGKTEMEDVKVSHEHHNFIWLPYDKALDKTTFENAKEILRRAQSLLS